MLTEEQVRFKLYNDFDYFARHCLSIRTKDQSIAPFCLNKAQQYLHAEIEKQLSTTDRVRVIILKGRQQGCSTYTEGRFYWKVIHRAGVRAFILTHDSEATNNLYEMVTRFYENTPAPIRPVVGTQNAKELDFTILDSGYKIGTAGNKAVGRSSTLQYFHWSEVAFSPNAQEHLSGILQSVPTKGKSEVILESTANGVDNYFHYLWEQAASGASPYKCIFIPWYWQDEYRWDVPTDFIIDEEEIELKALYSLDNEQIVWRRIKIQELAGPGFDGAKLFKQEFPCTATEAFIQSGDDTLIDVEIVERATKTDCEKVGPLVVGVDPARQGDDFTAIIKRQGRVAFDLETYQGKDTMQVVGAILALIKESSPDKIFIDVVGIGAGIVDRLRELGYSNLILPVNAGESAINKNLYANKGAEMWALMKKWLEDTPSAIPKDLGLMGELTGRRYSFDSKQRLVLESKKDMKKSPDKADALAMTFAMPISEHKFDWKKVYNPTIRI